LSVSVYDSDTSSVMLREERELWGFEKSVLRDLEDLEECGDSGVEKIA